MVEEKKWWLWKAPENARYIGKLVPRKDAAAKASGRHVYVADINLPGMLYAKPLRSPFANACIKRMDTSRVEKVEGVVAVIRWDDPKWKDRWPEFFPPWPGFQPPGRRFSGGEAPPHIPYIMHRAWWYGKPTGAVVVAHTEEAVDEAIKILKEDTLWEELPFCLNWDDAEKCEFAIRPEYEKYMEGAKENVEFQPFEIEFGDVEKGLREAERVIEFVGRWSEPNTWAVPEAATGVAQWLENHVNVWMDTQFTQSVRHQIAVIYGIPESAVHVEAPAGGAQFGGLDYMRQMAAIMAVLLSKAFQRPVKFIDDHYMWEGCEHVLGTYKFKIGFNSDGTITAVKFETVAVAPAFGFLMVPRSVTENTKIPNVYYRGQYPLINTGIRACTKEGAPMCLVNYLIINRVAAELGMDPTEVALKNDGCHGHSMEWIYENIAKQQGFDTSRWSLKECIEIGKKAIGWNEKWHPPGTRKLPNGKYHGIGFGATRAWAHTSRVFARGYTGLPKVYLSLTSDGSIRLVGHRSDTGVGSDTSYCMIVADEVGVRYEDVNPDFFDFKDFWFQPLGGSFGTGINTPILVLAARKLKREILKAAVELPEFKGKQLEELDVKESQVFEKANPKNSLPVAKAAYGQGLVVTASWEELLEELPKDQPCMVRQVIFTEVEVDPETGKIDVVNVVRVYDCGKIINLGAVLGQLEPSWGIGRSLAEAIYFDPLTGITLNDSFVNYPILLMNDIKNTNIQLIETGLAYGAYGSAGCSEAGAAAATPAIIPAVYNAIGKWIDDWPITPDKVLKALGKA